METARYHVIATLGDLGSAQVVAARLEAEGIPTRIHSEALGPYPLTVGQMAETRLLVPVDRVEEARLVLLDAEVTVALSGVERPVAESAWPLWAQVLAACVGLVLAVMVIWGAMQIN